MNSGDLTAEQARRLREAIGRQLRYLNKLCARMQRLGWPVEDPVCKAASAARDATQDLFTATHYMGCEQGVRKTG